jgi:hypothetical protein
MVHSIAGAARGLSAEDGRQGMNRYVFIWFGSSLMIFAMVCQHGLTNAFGGHRIPETTPEAIVDVGMLFVAVVGFVLATIGWALPKK